MRGWKEKDDDDEEEEENVGLGRDGQNNSTIFPPKAAICPGKSAHPAQKAQKRRDPSSSKQSSDSLSLFLLVIAGFVVVVVASWPSD